MVATRGMQGARKVKLLNGYDFRFSRLQSFEDLFHNTINMLHY